MKRINVLIVAAMLVTLAGCGRVQPILNIEHTPVALNPQSTQVKQAIIEAGTDRGWVMMETIPGKIRGEYQARSHHAIIDVTYSEKTYSIEYADSDNLKYEDGKIHRNYNRWVKNLDVGMKKKQAKLAQ